MRKHSPPIEGYDELNTRTISSRLLDLTDAELDEVEAYERRHKNRVTVLRRIDELRTR